MELDEFWSFVEGIQPELELFGNGILKYVEENLRSSNRLGILKIPAQKPRLKDKKSALGKVVRKNYGNPTVQMTDLVGIRFVALLHEDVDAISEIIKGGPWEYSLDREYEKEKLASPTTFTYQSNHFIITSRRNEFSKKIGIQEGLRCEVQVRTLLQHAYSELTHDTIYKPGDVLPPPQAHRLVARSAALIESTDDLFMQTVEQLRDCEATALTWFDGLCKLYCEVIGPDSNGFDPSVNIEFQVAFKDIAPVQNLELIKDFWLGASGKAFADMVRRRISDRYLFTQPMVLAIYVALPRVQHQFTRLWPYESLSTELDLIFSDLGLTRQ